jgi:hypothetical protein
MSVGTIHCIVADPTAGIVYDVSADYREFCAHAHDSRREHLCELTLRARPMQKPEVSLKVCDIAAVPTPVLVAIQTKLRALLAQPLTAARSLPAR